MGRASAGLTYGTNNSPCVHLWPVEIESSTGLSGRKLTLQARSNLPPPPKLPEAFHISIRTLTSPSLSRNTAHNHEISWKMYASVIPGATIC